MQISRILVTGNPRGPLIISLRDPGAQITLPAVRLYRIYQNRRDGGVFKAIDSTKLKQHWTNEDFKPNKGRYGVARKSKERHALIAPIDQASLTIPLGDIDQNPPYGTFEVFAFNGDGVVSGDEWYSGTVFHTFTGIGGWYPVLQCDVTNLLKDAVNRNVPFLSFNFRAGTGTDRYWLGDIQGLPYPTITIIPEPCTLLLLGIGGLLIRKR